MEPRGFIHPMGTQLAPWHRRLRPVSWPALAQPPTTLLASTPQVVGGRPKAGHDTRLKTGAVLPILAPMGPGPVMTQGPRAGRPRDTNLTRRAASERPSAPR
jgi:hypothetical protein